MGRHLWLISVGNEIAGVVALEDILKPHIHGRLEQFTKDGAADNYDYRR